MSKQKTTAVLAPCSLIPSGGFNIGRPVMELTAAEFRRFGGVACVLYMLIPERFVTREGKRLKYKANVVSFLQEQFAGDDFNFGEAGQGTNFKKSQPHSRARASLKGLGP